MTDTTLNLGGVVFTNLEIPTNIQFPTSQRIAVHKLLGGKRILDSMGADYAPREWSGLFFGVNAFARATALQSIAASGQQQTLTWGGLSYQVIVRDFVPDYHRQFEIPYHIICEVVADNTVAAGSSASPSVADALTSDGETAQQILADLRAAQGANLDSTSGLVTLLTDVISAIAVVKSFIAAPLSTIVSILQPLTAAISIVNGLIAIQDAALGVGSGFAGVTGGTNPLIAALALDNAESAALEEYDLWQLGGVLGRMAANLNAINGSPNTLAIAGGNLFQIAAQEYGDATDWTTIAQANPQLNGDPFIQGGQTLTIPLQPSQSGGVLNS